MVERGKQSAIRVPITLPQRGAALDIREEERDSAAKSVLQNLGRADLGHPQKSTRSVQRLTLRRGLSRCGLLAPRASRLDAEPVAPGAHVTVVGPDRRPLAPRA